MKRELSWLIMRLGPRHVLSFAGGLRRDALVCFGLPRGLRWLALGCFELRREASRAIDLVLYCVALCCVVARCGVVWCGVVWN